MELSTVDYWYLMREWQTLVSGRVQKVYMKDRMLLLQIYSKENYTWLFSDGRSFLTQAKIAFPQTPSGFTMFLRKRIQGGRIRSIELLGFDRIIVITIETKEGTYQLLSELFGDVNYLLCKDNKIISAFETHSFSDRTIRGGVEYTPPPSRPAPWDAQLQPLIGKEAARAVATELGLGGKYAEEVVARAKIDRKHVLTEHDLPAIQAQIGMLRYHDLAPQQNSKEALPYPFLTRPGEYTTAPSYNQAIDTVIRTTLESAESQMKEQEFKHRQSKQQKIIDAQKKQLEHLNATITESQRKGEVLYERYSEVQQLMEQLKHEWKTLSFAHLKEKYKEHPIIKSIEKDGTVELEL